MLKRLVLTVAILCATSTTAYGKPQITPDQPNPGVDVIIGEGSSGGPGPADEVGSGGGNGPSGPTPRENLEELCEDIGTVPVCLDPPEAGPEEEEPDIVDAAAVARTLRDRLDLPRPQMSTSPQAPVKALVGLETWLWVEPAQWEPVELSASLGGTTVTVTARPVQSLWNMGESTRACGGPGRVWQKGLGQNAKTSCGYTYSHTSLREPDDKYDVSATLRYGITWTCTGDCSAGAGDLGTLDSLADTAQLEVGERQSVVIR